MKSLRENKYWRYAFLWTLLIYSTLYAVRPICEYLKKVTPFSSLMNVLMVLLLGSYVVILWVQKRIKRISTFLLLLTVMALYTFSIMTIKYPEEKLHFAEYGFLAYLIYRALRVDQPRSISYAGALGLTFLLGWLDEGIQHILPNRYYQWDDVLLNAGSGFLGLCLTFIFERERMSTA